MGEYEITKLYTYGGIQVRSEIVKDEIRDDPRMRVVVSRSSCASSRWNGRTSDHVCQGPEVWTTFAEDLERARKSAAEALAKQELGEVPDKPIPVLGVKVLGTDGKALNTIASFHLQSPHCLLQPAIIAMLHLNRTPDLYFYGTKNPIAVPIFQGTVTFGEIEVTTTFVPSDHNGALFLGGDFLQKFVAGRENILNEVLFSDHRRAIECISRTKKNTILIIGAFGENRARLERIKQTVARRGFQGLIIDEFRAIEEQEFTEKMLTFASMTRFVVADDYAPSGHIKELDVCHYFKFITAVLRLNQRSATAMQDDLTRGVSYMREFSYDDDAQFESAVLAAIEWADDAVRSRSRDLNMRYGRGPFDVI